MTSDNDKRIRREDLHGTWAMERAEQIPDTQAKERAAQAKLHGLEASASIRDRSLTLFHRGRWGLGNGGTFAGAPFLEDMRQLGGQDVVIVGAPLDAGTTYRPGTRFGPQAMRRVSVLGGGYNAERGVNLIESLNMVDAGDIQVIPANLEKSFDQIADAIAHITERAVFPVVLGGDHSIGYPDIRGMAPFIDGKVGIIHFDRHSDLGETSFDERMHGSPFFHATNIANAPASNLVQIGIGGWTGSKPGMRVARDRGATVITIDDIDRFGIDRIIEFALEVAWKDAKAVWLSFDIDSLDPAFAPGTGTPEAGGLTTREAMELVRGCAGLNIVGGDVVEVAPQYDATTNTAQAAAQMLFELLAVVALARRKAR